MSKKNKKVAAVVVVDAVSPVAPTQEVSSIEAALANDATAQAAVAVATVNSAKAKYIDLAFVHPLQRVHDEAGNSFAPKNKGAFMAALWYAVCVACGYNDTTRYNASIGSICSKLGAYGVTHCASKGKPLAGAEISEAGAVGYARALKGALTGATDQHSMRFAQYLQGGKYANKADAEATLATLLVTLYGKVEGIDSCKRALSAVSVG
jgi:hypothetical protein